MRPKSIDLEIGRAGAMLSLPTDAGVLLGGLNHVHFDGFYMSLDLVQCLSCLGLITVKRSAMLVVCAAVSPPLEFVAHSRSPA